MTTPLTWHDVLAAEKAQPYFVNTLATVASERQSGQTIYPPQKDVFNAFRFTELNDVKVVILGQDPYHGPNQAHGLAFSVQPGIATPPSLLNMYKELEGTIPGFTRPNHGYLESWARQGVLLLNNTLTVEAGLAGSHAGRGWDAITDACVAAVAASGAPTVFILWGSHARRKASRVPLLGRSAQHLVIASAHPSPLSAHNGFFGSRPFSRTNEFLERRARGTIDWSL